MAYLEVRVDSESRIKIDLTEYERFEVGLLSANNASDFDLLCSGNSNSYGVRSFINEKTASNSRIRVIYCEPDSYDFKVTDEVDSCDLKLTDVTEQKSATVKTFCLQTNIGIELTSSATNSYSMQINVHYSAQTQNCRVILSSMDFCGNEHAMSFGLGLNQVLDVTPSININPYDN